MSTVVGGNKLSNERSFTTLLSGERLTTIRINNRTFLVKKSKMKLPGLSFLENTCKKNFKLNLVLVRVLVLKSKALLYKKG